MMITIYKIHKVETLTCGHAASSIIFSVSHPTDTQWLSSVSILGRISRRQWVKVCCLIPLKLASNKCLRLSVQNTSVFRNPAADAVSSCLSVKREQYEIFLPAHCEQVPSLHRGASARSPLSDKMQSHAERRHPRLVSVRSPSSAPSAPSQDQRLRHPGGTHAARLQEGLNRSLCQVTHDGYARLDFQNKSSCSLCCVFVVCFAVTAGVVVTVSCCPFSSVFVRGRINYTFFCFVLFVCLFLFVFATSLIWCVCWLYLLHF